MFSLWCTNHFKRDRPELKEKPRERRAQAKYARSEGECAHPESQTCQIAQVNDTVQKRDVEIGKVVKQVSTDFDSSRWYFDTGTNAHITACKAYFTPL